MEDEERRWTDENIDMVALKHFPNIDKEKAMSRPILYSNWLSKVSLTAPLGAWYSQALIDRLDCHHGTVGGHFPVWTLHTPYSLL